MSWLTDTAKILFPKTQTYTGSQIVGTTIVWTTTTVSIAGVTNIEFVPLRRNGLDRVLDELEVPNE